LAKKRITVGKSSISRFLHHLKLPFKKKPSGGRAGPSGRGAARKTLQRRQARLDPRKLVFIDETSVSTTITRLYGRAPQGERLVQKVLHGSWKTVTFIAALRHDRVTAPFVLDGAMNGEMFKAYVEQFLAPTLKRDDIVFMDNASVHMVEGVEEAIEARGAIPFYLPAYSPDLQPNRATIRQAQVHASEDRCLFSQASAFTVTASARQSPLVFPKSPDPNAPPTSPTQGTVNLIGNALSTSNRHVKVSSARTGPRQRSLSTPRPASEQLANTPVFCASAHASAAV